jgi:hypothetical protein
MYEMDCLANFFKFYVTRANMGVKFKEYLSFVQRRIGKGKQLMKLLMEVKRRSDTLWLVWLKMYLM